VCHPMDLVALGQFFFTSKLPEVPKDLDADWTWCYQKLVKTSRSFAAVILELSEELRGPVALFYLVLRALDTIEDDMKPSIEAKKKELASFYTHLKEPGYTLNGFGDKPHEIELLEKYDKLINAFSQLKPVYQDVISDICKRMGDGMAYFLDHTVDTIEDWELYCHYVAGLVGYGLSSLFGASGIESDKYGTKELEPLSNSMGLFLQKTNIIRDYLEDVSEVPPRLFWPKSVWSRYATVVQDLALYENKANALACLNELITDALKHALDCLDYLKDLKDPSVFAFCAIPQVMAISTLSLCYNNHDVFLYEVKIAKGEAVRLILAAKNYRAVVACFQSYAKPLLKRIPKDDPSASLAKSRLEALLARCEADLQ